MAWTVPIATIKWYVKEWGHLGTYTVKMKVLTAHHFVPMHTFFLFLVCVLGQFSVQYTLSFLQCNGVDSWYMYRSFLAS